MGADAADRLAHVMEVEWARGKRVVRLIRSRAGTWEWRGRSWPARETGERPVGLCHAVTSSVVVGDKGLCLKTLVSAGGGGWGRAKHPARPGQQSQGPDWDVVTSHVARR